MDPADLLLHKPFEESDGEDVISGPLLSTLFGCDTKSHEYLSRSSIEDLVFCHPYPTETCIGSNPGVRSSRDNEASVSKD
jgi:hypothetical protein